MSNLYSEYIPKNVAMGIQNNELLVQQWKLNQVSTRSNHLSYSPQEKVVSDLYSPQTQLQNKFNNDDKYLSTSGTSWIQNKVNNIKSHNTHHQFNQKQDPQISHQAHNTHLLSRKYNNNEVSNHQMNRNQMNRKDHLISDFTYLIEPPKAQNQSPINSPRLSPLAQSIYSLPSKNRYHNPNEIQLSPKFTNSSQGSLIKSNSTTKNISHNNSSYHNLQYQNEQYHTLKQQNLQSHQQTYNLNPHNQQLQNLYKNHNSEYIHSPQNDSKIQSTHNNNNNNSYNRLNFQNIKANSLSQVQNTINTSVDNSIISGSNSYVQKTVNEKSLNIIENANESRQTEQLNINNNIPFFIKDNHENLVLNNENIHIKKNAQENLKIEIRNELNPCQNLEKVSEMANSINLVNLTEMNEIAQYENFLSNYSKSFNAMKKSFEQNMEQIEKKKNLFSFSLDLSAAKKLVDTKERINIKSPKSPNKTAHSPRKLISPKRIASQPNLQKKLSPRQISMKKKNEPFTKGQIIEIITEKKSNTKPNSNFNGVNSPKRKKIKNSMNKSMSPIHQANLLSSPRGTKRKSLRLKSPKKALSPRISRNQKNSRNSQSSKNSFYDSPRDKKSSGISISFDFSSSHNSQTSETIKKSTKSEQEILSKSEKIIQNATNNFGSSSNYIELIQNLQQNLPVNRYAKDESKLNTNQNPKNDKIDSKFFQSALSSTNLNDTNLISGSSSSSTPLSSLEHSNSLNELPQKFTDPQLLNENVAATLAMDLRTNYIQKFESNEKLYLKAKRLRLRGEQGDDDFSRQCLQRSLDIYINLNDEGGISIVSKLLAKKKQVQTNTTIPSNPSNPSTVSNLNSTNISKDDMALKD